MDQSNVYDLLGRLLSTDNEVRKAAEAEYEAAVAAQPAFMMHALAEVCGSSQDAASLTMALILLRKVINSEAAPFATAEPAVQNAVKGHLTQVLGTAAYNGARGSAVACVSALAVQMQKAQMVWEELWANIFTIMENPQSGNELLTVCCEIVSASAVAMGAYFTSHAAAIATGLKHGLIAQGNSKAVKRSAFSAIIRLSNMGLIDTLRPLVDDMLNVIAEALNSEDWDSAAELTESLAEGINEAPTLFRGKIANVLGGLMAVASSPIAPASVRHRAIEALLTYCESDPKAVRKVPDFSTAFFQLLFEYTLINNHPEDWDVSEVQNDEDDLEDDTDQIIGCAGIDRIANALGARKLQETAKGLFMSNIQSPEWERRNAALLLICYCAEGMSTTFAKMISTLVPYIVPSVKDDNKFVRASALDCLAQLCNDFAPTLQQHMHQTILPPVTETLCDPIPHVAGSAARCLDSFFDSVVDDEDDDVDVGKVFAPYIERICVDCVQLLQKTQYTFVRENALSALSSLTSTGKELLAPYTDALVPVYQEVLAMPDSPDMMNMKCKAIECVTLLACGVGKEKFSPYAVGVCNYLSSFCAQGLSPNDVRSRFIARGWTCMVECLKEDVIPYMKDVMPMLLSMMNLECDAVLSDVQVGDDDDENGEDAANGVESCRFIIPGVGEKVAKFHTSLIEDKELASNVVNAILGEVGIALLDYFPDIAQSAIKLLDFMVNSEIRENGAFILSEIIECYTSANMIAQGQQLAAATFPEVIKTMASEAETDVIETLTQLVLRCVTAYPGVIDGSNAHMVCEKLLATLNEMVKLRNENLAKAAEEHASGEVDEDALDMLGDEDEKLQSVIESMGDVVGTLLQHASATFAPLFVQHFFPVISTWLDASADDFSVSRGFAILCDFVEHASSFVGPSLSAMCSSTIAFGHSRTDAGLLQSNFYMMNVLTQYLGHHGDVAVAAGVNVGDFVSQAKGILITFLTAPESATEDYAYTACNAVSALVTMLSFYGTGPLASEAAFLLQTVVSRLPVHGDEVEAVRVHDRVLGWLVGNSPLLQTNPSASGSILSQLKAATPKTLSEDAKMQLKTM